jgi:predicted transcriptional regulator
MPKVMISISDDLLRRVDREVHARGTTRSAFLQEAARHELGWPDPATVDAAITRGRAALAHAGGFESADAIRSERDARDA